MSSYTKISENEMAEFMTEHGFSPLNLPDVYEHVYGKLVLAHKPAVTLRIYTTIDTGKGGRPCGADAIRLVLVTKDSHGDIKPIGQSQKVYRIETWRQNLLKKINSWNEFFGPPCPKCNHHTIRRNGKWGEFWGCVNFPDCRGLTKD